MSGLVAEFQRQLTVLVWGVLIAVFALSGELGPAYSVESLYTISVLLCLWTPSPYLAPKVSLAATALVALGLYLRPPIALRHDLLDRTVLVAVLWVTAFVVERVRTTEAARREAQARLTLAVAARTEADGALGRSLRSLEEFKYALDQSAIVAMTNVQGDITYVNDTFCKISKYPREELIGRNHRMLNSGLHPVEFFKEMYRAIANGQVWRGELRNRAKDGTLYWVDTTIVPFVDEEGKPYQYVAVRYDITARKESEARVRETESLAQIGKMAAVVAHEVRNPLAGIRGALQIIQRRVDAASPEHKVMAEIITRIDTLSDIVQDLLFFARPRQPVLAHVPADALLQETIALLRADPASVGVRIELDVADLRIDADLEMLKLVLLNLMMNGAQAMKGAGTLRIEASEADAWHEIRLIDHGPGIPPNVREHLFEPFFTTKHRGTGLGLATARRMIDAHGGTIALECPATGGTVVTIRLPRIAADPAGRR